MAVQQVANPQLVAPASAAGVSITPSASSWTNSVWVEVIAAMAGAGVLTGVVLGVAGTDGQFEVDVGVGAVGLEAVIATFQGNVETTPAFCGMGQMILTIPIAALPAGGRVSIRLRKPGSSTTAWRFALTYYLLPLSGTLLTTTKPQKCVPTAATWTILPAHASIAWANGIWVQMMASAAADLAVVAIAVPRWYNGQNIEIDLGVGAIGSEIALMTFRAFDQLGDGPNYTPLPIPFTAILAGQRVVARSRHAVSSILNNTYFGFSYYELPL